MGLMVLRPPCMDLVVECMYIGSDAKRILFLSGVYRQLPVSVWKLEHGLNANKNLPLHFTAEVHVAVYGAGLPPDTPTATVFHGGWKLQP